MKPPDPLPTPPKVHRVPAGFRVLRFFSPKRGAWAHQRFFGPIADMRFDHHPPPCRLQSLASVWYAATSLRGAVVETFARAGAVDRSGPTKLAVATVVEPIELLDLVGTAARWVGATQEIAATTDFAATQAWARAFHGSFPALGGLRWRGRQAGSLCLLLTERASMAALRAEVLPLTDPHLWPRIARAARDCRLKVV